MLAPIPRDSSDLHLHVISPVVAGEGAAPNQEAAA